MEKLFRFSIYDGTELLLQGQMYGDCSLDIIDTLEEMYYSYQLFDFNGDAISPYYYRDVVAKVYYKGQLYNEAIFVG